MRAEDELGCEVLQKMAYVFSVDPLYPGLCQPRSKSRQFMMTGPEWPGSGVNTIRHRMDIYNELDPELSPPWDMMDLTLTTVMWNMHSCLHFSGRETEAGFSSSPEAIQLKSGRAELHAQLHLISEAMLLAFHNNGFSLLNYFPDCFVTRIPWWFC